MGGAGTAGAFAFSPGRYGAAGDQFFHLGAAAFFALHRIGCRHGAQELLKDKTALPAFIVIDWHFFHLEKLILAQGTLFVKRQACPFVRNEPIYRDT